MHVDIGTDNKDTITQPRLCRALPITAVTRTRRRSHCVTGNRLRSLSNFFGSNLGQILVTRALAHCSRLVISRTTGQVFANKSPLTCLRQPSTSLPVRGAQTNAILSTRRTTGLKATAFVRDDDNNNFFDNLFDSAPSNPVPPNFQPVGISHCNPDGVRGSLHSLD